MKNTSKLIGILSALIVVILAVFLVTKFNSHESARVSTSSSPAKTVKKSSSSSSKAVKKDKKNSNPHVNQCRLQQFQQLRLVSLLLPRILQLKTPMKRFLSSRTCFMQELQMVEQVVESTNTSFIKWEAVEGGRGALTVQLAGTLDNLIEETPVYDCPRWDSTKCGAVILITLYSGDVD